MGFEAFQWNQRLHIPGIINVMELQALAGERESQSVDQGPTATTS